MLEYVPAAGAGGSLLRWLWSRLAKRPVPVAAVVFDPPVGVRILRNPEEITIISRRAADHEYRQATRMYQRGDYYTRLSEAVTRLDDR